MLLFVRSLQTICLMMFVTFSSASASELAELFPVKKPIIAALALKMPRANQLTSASVKQAAIAYGRSQMDILAREGVDGVIWEVKAGGIESPRLSVAQTNWMTEVIQGIVAGSSSPVLGVELLWHYPKETLQIAKEVGAKFVRIDFFSDDMVADGHRVQINPTELIAYRHSIGADNIKLFTDIQVKYAEMVDPTITIAQSARTALGLGSDGVIVSGRESGVAPTEDRVHTAKEGAADGDVIIGSGLSAENAANLLRYADGAFCGTSISEQTGGPLVPQKVRQLMTTVAPLRH